MNALAVLRTAFNSNLATVQVSEKDQAALAAKGIQQPALQKYVLWRRASIIMVVVATLLSAGVTWYSEHTDNDADEVDVIETIKDNLLEKLQKALPSAAGLSDSAKGKLKSAKAKLDEVAPGASGLADSAKEKLKEKLEETKAEKADGKDDAAAKSDAEEDDEEEPAAMKIGDIIDTIHDYSLYFLAAAALVALFLGDRLRLSYYVLLAGFLISFLIPFITAVMPDSAWGGADVITPNESPAKVIVDQAADVMLQVQTVLLLLPAVFSLVPGVVKGCLRVKTLLPQSILPGWLVVMAAPLYGLFLLVIFVGIDQVTTQPFILGGFFLVVASSLIYAFNPSAFTDPLLTPANYARLKTMQRTVGLLTAVGGLLILGFLLTRDFFGVHLLGGDPKTALMRPIEVFEFVLEVISRGMFVSAVSADLFLRANLASWKQSKALAASPDVANYDSAMEAVGEAV